jgi:hypothetical protein
MVLGSMVDKIPLWGLTLITFAIIFLSTELGWRIGEYHRRTSGPDEGAPVSGVVGATFGLLAFLLAFTFGMAATRYENRKAVILQEANSIGTTYLRADFLQPEHRKETRQLLREYTRLRAGGMAALLSTAGREKSSAILLRLWQIAAEDGASHDSVLLGTYIQALNDTIDLDTTRVTALRNRIPDPIWVMLGLVTVFSMVALGFQFGQSGVRSWLVMALLIIVFTTVLVLIADLDHPQRGLIQTSQQPLLDLMQQISPE